MVEGKKLLRVAAVARLLDVNRNAVYELVKTGGLPTVRVGKHIRVDPGALEAWMNAGGSQPPRGTDD